jgi:hypothetical protein
MKSNELRIGNYIQTEYEGILQVVNINSEGFDYVDCRKPNYKALGRYEIEVVCKPIPITEEWLLKFGFVKEENNIDVCYQIEIKDGYFLEYFKSMTYTSLMLREVNNVVGDSLFYLPNIPTFVHSLQNLCFALTGKELEIK